ncbi:MULTISPECIES: hypothetical protein [Legionella]|uniref:Uncharacterized protein n=1 Tax=Legionella resiliens TaxID=2905958 RepID=A0ABS8X1A3_9GAMM|nr:MULTISPECIES: hypothetical protein [unclassified Legionella]MCE0722601.1 hypothetical protein [Legionella sp. 9fVS26]MCE3531754.1 hypothetical protein [Legionella sp. 8cVS16]QLZ67779.1 hypothetical protein FOLKNPGA_00552 [Legionella sp. PC1000]
MIAKQQKIVVVFMHYSELITILKKLKKKIWLYHYNPGKLPNAKADAFLGFVKKGQSFLFLKKIMALASPRELP